MNDGETAYQLADALLTRLLRLERRLESDEGIAFRRHEVGRLPRIRAAQAKVGLAIARVQTARANAVQCPIWALGILAECEGLVAT